MINISRSALQKYTCDGFHGLNTSERNNCSTRAHSFWMRDCRSKSKGIVSPYSAFDFCHLDSAASRAISDLRLALRLWALDFPPFSPPRRPKATAAGFFTACPFVLAATIEAATWFISFFDTKPQCLSGQGYANGFPIQTEPLPAGGSS